MRYASKTSGRIAPDDALDAAFGPGKSPTRVHGAEPARDAGDGVAAPSDGSPTDDARGDGARDDGARERADRPKGVRNRLRRFRRKRPKLSIAIVVVMMLFVPLGWSYSRALTKPGTESFMARNVQWMRDLRLGFIVDWVEQRYYANDEYPDGGTPDAALLGPLPSTTTLTTGTGLAPASTVPAIPHLTPPTRMASPVPDPLPGEGEWAPVGPLVKGLPGAYVTRVRPNAQKTSLLVFVAWADPKLTSFTLYPGIDVPGGDWATPNFITPDVCANAIMAVNGGFRMDQARGGYYAEGREPYKLRDGAASLVLYKDGRIDVGMWGRDFSHDQLGEIESVRQNLELMVDNGAPAPDLMSDKDWGALLKNVYFVWRSGYGVTKDGALVYAGGPALTPADLAATLMNAGAVRVMEGDINPEWVTANLYSVGADGRCHGTKGLDGPEDKGGMRQPADRYLETDTRDFLAIFARPS